MIFLKVKIMSLVTEHVILKKYIILKKKTLSLVNTMKFDRYWESDSVFIYSIHNS